MSKRSLVGARQYGDIMGVAHNGGRSCDGENCLICWVNSCQGIYDDTCLGRILTVIDAVIVDDRQNKSSKDIIRQAFHDEQWNKSVAIEKAIGRFLDGKTAPETPSKVVA